MRTARRQRSTVIGVLVALSLLVCANAFAQSVGYSYDSLNRLTRIVYADGTTVIYTYDAAGNRLTMTVTACEFVLSGSGATFGGVGGGGTVDITTTSGCAWTAVSNDSFLSVTGGAGGTGSGTMTYSVAANDTGSARVGTLFIAGRTYTVTQSAAFAPAITTHPSNTTATSGSNATFTVVASGTPAPSYQWQASIGGGAFTNLAEAAPYSSVTTPTLTVAASSNLNATQYRAVATNSVGSVTSNAAVLTVYGPVSASPSALRFAATKNGAEGELMSVTPFQSVTVTAEGAPSAWTAAVDQPWLLLTNTSGTGVGQFTVSIVNPGNVLGGSTSVTATITITPTLADLLKATVAVTLTIDQTATATAPPFGQVDTPAQNATGVQGAIGVTGWALDDIGVGDVKIYRNCLAFDNPASCQMLAGANVVYIGDAAFVAGARPDVETAFSGSPRAYRGGWGYMMLTTMLPDVTNSLAYGGQGSLTIYAFATDAEGTQTLLGRTQTDHTPTGITMDNASIAKPFGAIDTPGQGQTVSGALANFGWALTPDSDTTTGNGDIEIPTDGSSMVVFIDGVATGQVHYNQCRGDVGNPLPAGQYCNDDVANIFGNATPQPTLTTRTSNPTLYRNLDVGRAAIGSYDIDTAALTNGLHSIAWSVTDSTSRVEGIGSRNFIVLNGSSDRAAVSAAIDEPARIVGRAADLSWRPVGGATVWGRAGFDLRATWQTVEPDSLGTRHVQIAELGRLELDLGAGVTSGYLSANGALRPLPAGSQVTGGRFTWAPAAGYFGTYELVFLDGISQVPVRVSIRPASEPARIEAYLDTPRNGAWVRGPFAVAGWAADSTAWTGSGIGAVHIWAHRRDVAGIPPTFLGVAELGVWRPDVGAALGAQFERAGWQLAAPVPAPGEYDVVAYFWSVRTQRFEDARTVRVTVR